MATQSISPELQHWTIAGKQYSQEPFGLDRTSKLLELVAGVFSDLASVDVGKIREVDASTPDATAEIMGILTRKGPEALTSLICLCLDVTDPEERDEIYRRCRPVQAMGIVKAFLQQNDVQEILDSFLGLRDQFRRSGLRIPESGTAAKSGS